MTQFISPLLNKNKLNIIQIAHRGYSDLYPDNSYFAFTEAVNAKFDMIELDVQITKDCKLVIHHDLFINDKFIIDTTLEDLESDSILTLERFFKIVNIDNTKVYLDLKGSYRVAELLYKYLIDNNLHNHKNIYIASFNYKHIQYFVSKNSRLKLGFITCNHLLPRHLKSILVHIQFIAFDWQILDKESITICKSQKKKVFTYTCDSDIVFKRMLKFDIDGIVTNYKLRLP